MQNSIVKDLLPQIRLPRMRGMQQESPTEVSLVKTHPEYGKVLMANFTWLICAILQVTRSVHYIEWGEPEPKGVPVTSMRIALTHALR